MNQLISTKDPAEVIPVTFDFSRLIARVDNVTVGVSVLRGIDANPENLLFGSATIKQNKVTQFIQNGNTGVVYKIRMDVTSGSLKYVLCAHLPVVAL